MERIETSNMVNKTTQYQRLKQVRDWYKSNYPGCNGNESAVLRKMGLSNGFFSIGDRLGYKGVRESTLVKILNADNDINIEWVRSGTGEMFCHPETAGRIVNESKPSMPFFNADFLTDDGWVTTVHEGRCEYHIDYKPFSRQGNFWCNVTGDSMSPTINGGDKICLSPVGDIDKIIYGCIYAIVMRNDIRTVKRIVGSEKKDCIRLVSDNKEARFGDYQDIAKSDVLYIYKVVGAIRSF